MKKITLLIILLTSTICSFGQIPANDTVRIKHTNYTTVFSRSLHYPVLVSWWDTKAKTKCLQPLKRNNTFCADPLLPGETNLAKDYVGSGFDKGHNDPCDDNLCQTDQVERECFYFSNMTPQYHSTNAGSWENLEKITRNITSVADSVHVWCGSFGFIKKIGRVSVPLNQWKVIYIVKQKTFRAFLFVNTKDDSGNGKNGIEVPVAKIEQLTGFKFK